MLCMWQGIMSRLYETAAVLVLVAVVIYGLVRVVSALLESHSPSYGIAEPSSMLFRVQGNTIITFAASMTEMIKNWSGVYLSVPAAMQQHLR